MSSARFRGAAAVVTVLVTVALTATSAAALTWGGSGGVVSLHRVGPLRMNISGTRAVRRYAGKPSRIIYQSDQGMAASPAKATYMGMFYGTATKGTQYWLHRAGSRWHLQQFSTTSNRWRTPAGTRAGMTYKQAQSREHVPWQGGCVASGFIHATKAPFYEYGAVVYGPHRKVTGLYASGPHPPLC